MKVENEIKILNIVMDEPVREIVDIRNNIMTMKSTGNRRLKIDIDTLNRKCLDWCISNSAEITIQYNKDFTVLGEINIGSMASPEYKHFARADYTSLIIGMVEFIMDGKE